jgi:hypothetical protein
MSLSVKLLIVFAVCAYLWTLALALVPPSKLELPAPLVFLLCPACLLTITVDPAFSTVALILAPLNAVVYGLFGLVLGSALHHLNS